MTNDELIKALFLFNAKYAIIFYKFRDWCSLVFTFCVPVLLAGIQYQ